MLNQEEICSKQRFHVESIEKFRFKPVTHVLFLEFLKIKLIAIYNVITKLYWKTLEKYHNSNFLIAQNATRDWPCEGVDGIEAALSCIIVVLLEPSLFCMSLLKQNAMYKSWVRTSQPRKQSSSTPIIYCHSWWQLCWAEWEYRLASRERSKHCTTWNTWLSSCNEPLKYLNWVHQAWISSLFPLKISDGNSDIYRQRCSVVCFSALECLPSFPTFHFPVHDKGKLSLCSMWLQGWYIPF